MARCIALYLAHVEWSVAFVATYTEFVVVVVAMNFRSACTLKYLIFTQHFTVYKTFSHLLMHMIFYNRVLKLLTYSSLKWAYF